MTNPDPSRFLPLSTPVFHILLALGMDHLHGYGIMQAVEAKTAGGAQILPGTLYTTLNRMMADELVEEAPPPRHAPDDERRGRYYRVTPFGRAVVEAEVRRMSLLLEIARRDLQISWGNGAAQG